MFRKIFGALAVGILFCAVSADAQKSRTPLLECKEIGGRTANGAYFVNFTVQRNGSVKFEANTGKKTAILSKADLTLLDKKMNAADYKAITATKSNKMSPAAYDSIETTYIFYTKGKRHQVAPYKYIIPNNTALLKTVETLRQRYKLYPN